MTGVKKDFLASQERRTELLNLIDELMDTRLTQDKLDEWYGSFVKVYHSEMEKFYRRLGDAPVSKKNYYTARKEWWLEELGALAKDTLVAACQYQKTKTETKLSNGQTEVLKYATEI